MTPRSDTTDVSGITTGRRGALLGALALVVVVAVIGGLALLAGPSVLRATGIESDDGSPGLPADLTTPDPTPDTATADPQVLPPAPTGAAVDSKAMGQRIAGVSYAGVGGSAGIEVVDTATGKKLYGSGQGALELPASTLKILTATAVLHRYGPEHRFSTTVRRVGEGRYVLVGGGDPLLTVRTDRAHPERAALADLVPAVVAEARRRGETSIRIDHDDSAFAGTDWNPDWPESYRDQTTPTSALWIDEGRLQATSPGSREQQPAKAAAEAFAELVSKQGLRATVGSATSDSGGARVAAVRSPRLATLVEEMLLHSDNDIAEVLFRQVGRHDGGDGSVAAARKEVPAALADLDLPIGSARIRDGSGLSRENRVSAALLTSAVRDSLSADHPELRAISTGLPVAGATGSLTGRFQVTATSTALGKVRAKTGTLRQTHALAGWTVTAEGRPVAFALLVNGATNDYAARVWLDRVAAAIAGCC